MRNELFTRVSCLSFCIHHESNRHKDGTDRKPNPDGQQKDANFFSALPRSILGENQLAQEFKDQIVFSIVQRRLK